MHFIHTHTTNEKDYEAATPPCGILLPSSVKTNETKYFIINPQREFLKNKAIRVRRGFVERRVEKSKSKQCRGMTRMYYIHI